MGSVAYAELIRQLEDEKLETLMRLGESEQTLQVFERNDKKLVKLYEWLQADLEKGIVHEDLVKRSNN